MLESSSLNCLPYPYPPNPYIQILKSNSTQITPISPPPPSPYDPNAFSCEGQYYGYYADVASGCEVGEEQIANRPKLNPPTQIFHICLPIQDNDGLVTSTAKYSFFCGNGTVFDQQALVCNHADDAFPCEESPSLFGSVPFGEVLEDY